MNKKTLKDFTPEIQAKIPEYIKKYTKGVFDGGRYNSFIKENAEKLIDWNYEECGRKKPVVLVAENPYESQIFFNYIISNKEIFVPLIYINYCIKNKMDIPKNITEVRMSASQLYSQLDSQLYSQLGSQLRSQLDSQLYSQLGSQLRSQLDSQLRSQLDSQLGSQLYSQLYSQLGSQLRSQLDSQLGSQLDSQLGSQLDSQLGSQLYSQLYSQLGSQLGSQLRSQLRSQYHSDYLFTTNVYSNSLLAWWKFIKDEFSIESEIGIKLDYWNELYENSNVYSAIFSELVCIVSKYPKHISRNQENDLHNTEVNAVKWGYSTDLTKFECFYVNGRNISSALFNKVINKQFAFSDFKELDNEDEKACVLTMIKENEGNEGLMNFLNAVCVDSKTVKHENGYEEILELYQTKEKFDILQNSKGEFNQPYAWIKMTCPSTKSTYLIDTCPTFTDVVECAKWHRPKSVPTSVNYIWQSAN